MYNMFLMWCVALLCGFANRNGPAYDAMSTNVPKRVVYLTVKGIATMIRYVLTAVSVGEAYMFPNPGSANGRPRPRMPDLTESDE